jgi:hypothetical protein
MMDEDDLNDLCDDTYKNAKLNFTYDNELGDRFKTFIENLK